MNTFLRLAFLSFIVIILAGISDNQDIRNSGPGEAHPYPARMVVQDGIHAVPIILTENLPVICYSVPSGILSTKVERQKKISGHMQLAMKRQSHCFMQIRPGILMRNLSMSLPPPKREGVPLS